MIGKPKYTYGDKVLFRLKEDGKTHIVEGEIQIIDKYGTFFQDKEVSYDIMSEHSHLDFPLFYKHIIETDIIDKVER